MATQSLSLHSVRAVLAAVALAAALSSIPAVLQAQPTGRIIGSVVTADGEPVSDAMVTVVSTGARAAVDEDGRFVLEVVPAGTQLLEVSGSRHARGVERVVVVAGETTRAEILLHSQIHAEQIVVTAVPGGRGELDLASPVNILEGHELALRLQPSLGETLAREPGVTSTSFAPGASRPVVRGLSGDRVRMLENGLGTGDVSSTSPDHAVGTDPLSTERIEVVRGPATLLYGGSAIGGVVNLIDRRIPEYLTTQRLTGTVDLRAGSVAEETSGALELEGGAGPWAWHLDLMGRETDDYEIPGTASLEEEHEEGDEEHEEVAGLLPNSDLRSTAGGLGASYFFGDTGYLGASVRGFETEYGIPGGHHHEEEGDHDEEGGEEEEAGLRIDMRQRRYDLKGGLTRPFGIFQGATLRIGIVDYEHDELEAPGVVGTTFFNDSWEGRLELIQRTRDGHHGSLGLQVQSRDLEAVGEEAFIPPVETQSIGLFTFQEIERGPLRYQMGLRYETQDTTVRDAALQDRDFDGLSGSLGIVWQPRDGYSIGASLARSVKMPNSEELYSDGLHFATSSFEQGDPTLGKESALGFELSLRKTEGRLSGSLNLFHNRFSDFIFQNFTGEEVEGLPVLRYSQADADFQGAEIDLSLTLSRRAHSSWDLDLLWDLVRAEFDGGGNLPRIPPQRYGAGIHFRGDRLRAGAGVRRIDRQGRVAENETPTGGYTTVDADLSYRFFFDRQVLDLILQGNNLTDEEARNHVSFVKDSVPLPGRDIRLIARFAF
jgi:iron complex outermembrane receptor protein